MKRANTDDVFLLDPRSGSRCEELLLRVIPRMRDQRSDRMVHRVLEATIKYQPTKQDLDQKAE